MCKVSVPIPLAIPSLGDRSAVASGPIGPVQPGSPGMFVTVLVPLTTVVVG